MSIWLLRNAYDAGTRLTPWCWAWRDGAVGGAQRQRPGREIRLLRRVL